MAPTQAQIDAIFLEFKARVDALFAQSGQSTAGRVTSNLQAAINAANSGATLWLGPSFQEFAPITIAKPLTILGDGASELRGGVDIQGSNVSLSGLSIYKDQARNDVVTITGDTVALTDVKVLGHPSVGQKRGIAANGKNITLRRVNVDQIWTAVDTQDSQALCGWDNCINLLAEDCSFVGATESVLIGGADPKDATRKPRNITMRRCVLTKRLEWRTPNHSVKTTLELKNVSGFLLEDSTIENSWKQSETDGQDGYLITLTPRNQDGTAPYSSVEDVTIQRCSGGHAAGFINILGTDNEKPSGLLQRVKIDNCTMSEFDRRIWRASAAWGTDKLIQIVRGSVDLSVTNNTLQGNLGAASSALYFDELPKSKRLIVTGNHWPKSEWGVFGGNSAPNQAWVQYVDPVGSQFSENTEL